MKPRPRVKPLRHAGRAAGCILLCLLLAAGLLLSGCRTGQAGTGGAGGGDETGEQVTSAPRPDASPPPGLDARAVAPLGDEALTRARMTLAQVVASVPAPDFLQPAGGGLPPAPADAEPPVAAQREYIAGRLAWRRGDSFKAIPHLQSALRLAPRQPDILRLLGRIYTGMGNKVRGAEYFREAVRADPTDLEGVFLLGRFAIERGDWSGAVAVLHAARGLLEQAESPRPAIDRLLSFYLATALMQDHFAAAAIEAYHRYLDGPSYLPHATAFAREVELLEQQTGATWQAIGDLHHQLGQVEQARAAYDKAAEIGVLDPLGLMRRRLYTRVRLGLDGQAQSLVLEQVRSGDAEAAGIGLVRYLIEQGAAGAAFAHDLAGVYKGRGRSPSLALAMDDLLPPERGQALLIEHLEHRPQDQRVFERLVSRHLLPRKAASSPRELRHAIQVTAGLMDASPDEAGSFAVTLVRTAGGRAMLDAMPPAEAATPDRSMHAVLRGLAAAEAGRIDDARAVFERVLEAEPDLVVARLQLARLLVLGREFDRAARVLEPLADQDDAQVISLRVHVLSETGQTDRALELLDRMIHRGDADTGLILQKASLQAREGEAVAAERTLLDALNMRPQDERLYQALLDLYDPRAGQSPIPDSMRQWQRLVRRLLGTIPYSRIGRLVRAELHDAKGEFDQAEALLKGLLAEDEHDARALRDLLQLYLRANRRDEALALLEQRTAHNLNDPQLLALIGRFYKDLGEFDKMLGIVEQLLLTRPDDPERSLALARLALDRGRPDRAETLARQVLSAQAVADPRQAVGLLSEALLAQQRGDEAEKTLRDAADRFPAHAADLIYAHAALVTQRGDRGRADDILRDLLERFPDHGPANNDLGYNWASHGKNLDQARAMIQKAVDSDPQSAAYLDSLGWVYYKLGRFEDAQTWLRRSRQAQGGQNPVIVEHLGDTLYRLNQHDQAVRAWEQAIVLMQTGLPARLEQTGNVLYQLGRVADAAHLWLRARALTDGSRAVEDPEMRGLVERARAKIEAVRANQPADAAPVPGG